MPARAVSPEQYVHVRNLGVSDMAGSSEVSHFKTCERAVLKRPSEGFETSAVEESWQQLRALASLEHESLARILHCNAPSSIPGDGTRWVLREYVKGDPLDVWLATQPHRDWNLACTLGYLMLLGVIALHRAGHCHGNLKPPNVIVGRYNSGRLRVTLVDAGWRRADVAGESNDHRLDIDGRYKSPEVTVGDAASPRSDLFSVAVMMYEMLTGSPLVDADDEFDTFGTIATGTVEPLALRNPLLPEPLVRAIETCLDADPARRLPSAEAFARQLRPYLDSQEYADVTSGIETGSEHEAKPSLQLRDAPRPRRDAACTDRMLINPRFPRLSASSLLDELRENVESCPSEEREWEPVENQPPRSAPDWMRAVAASAGLGVGAALAWFCALV